MKLKCVLNLPVHNYDRYVSIGVAVWAKGRLDPPPHPTFDGGPSEIDTDPRHFGVGKNWGRLPVLPHIFELNIPSPFYPAANFLLNSLRVFRGQRTTNLYVIRVIFKLGG